MKIKDIVLEDLVSGQKYPYSFTIELVDYDDQVLITDSSSTIEIYGDGVESKTVMQSVSTVSKGVATFNNIGFAATPGS